MEYMDSHKEIMELLKAGIKMPGILSSVDKEGNLTYTLNGSINQEDIKQAMIRYLEHRLERYTGIPSERTKLHLNACANGIEPGFIFCCDDKAASITPLYPTGLKQQILEILDKNKWKELNIDASEEPVYLISEWQFEKIADKIIDLLKNK